MKKFSLLLAAAVMVVGPAVSGSASAEDIPSDYEILTEGEILMKSGSMGGEQHFFTVHYGGEIYGCTSVMGAMFCMKSYMQTSKATEVGQ